MAGAASQREDTRALSVQLISGDIVEQSLVGQNMVQEVEGINKAGGDRSDNLGLAVSSPGDRDSMRVTES